MAVIYNNPYGAYEKFVKGFSNLPLWRMGAFAGIAGVLFRLISYELVSATCLRGMVLIFVAKLCTWILSRPKHPASRFSAVCFCAAMEIGVMARMAEGLNDHVPYVPMVLTVLGWVVSAAMLAAVIGLLVRIFVAMFLN